MLGEELPSPAKGRDGFNEALDVARDLKTRYRQMITALKQKGTKVVRYQTDPLKPITEAGRRLFDVPGISQVSTVDVVFDPAAGGGLVKLVAATGREESVVDPKLIALLANASTEVVRGLLAEASEEDVTAIKEAHPELAEKITEALAARKAIERAKGLLMEKEGLSEQDAFARLRRASQVSGRPLKVVAEAVVATFGAQ